MHCPICKKPVNSNPGDPKSPYPFCSDRCKLIDLGRWLDGRYQVPVAPDDDDESSDKPDPPPSPE